jgi:hypothetical protein
MKRVTCAEAYVKGVHTRQLLNGSTPVMRCTLYLELKYLQTPLRQFLVALRQLASELRRFAKQLIDEINLFKENWGQT